MKGYLLVKVIDKYGLNRREINIITNLVSAYISVAEKDFKSMYHDYKKAPSPQTDFVGLVHTVKGVGKITTAENVYVLNRNDALFINYHDVISFESVDSEWEFYTLWFRVTNFKLDMNKIIYVAPLPNERETMETIINLLNTDEYMNCCKANTLAQRLILDVMAESFVDDSSFYVDSMRKIASYIHRNINDNISIKDLAKRCSVSKNHFCNLFKQYYKMLPKDYIQREKLKKAAFLLLNTAMPIQDISSELSYSSPAYFASCFKEFYKLTPTEFRQTESIEKKFLNVSVFFVYVLWLAKERSCSIDKALEMVKGLGYSAIEVDKDELIEYPTLADKILDKGLKVSSVYGYYNLMKEDTLDAFELIDFAVKCKSDVAMILPGAFQNEELTEDIISDQNKMREFLENNDSVLSAVEKLKKTVEYAKSKGVTLTIEDVGTRNSLTGFTSQIKWLLEKVEGLKFTFDTGNFYLNGQDLDYALETFKPYTVHVHCKDYLSEPKPDSPNFSMADISVAVGKGVCPVSEIVNTFIANKYKGYFTVEYLGREGAYGILSSSIKTFKL